MLVGFHGQTVLHRPDEGLTVQIGDGAALARALRLPVVHDFRAADVAAGGQGAPLVPVYHKALALSAGLTGPIVVFNVGGVANLTFLDGDEDPQAFDTGPGNALIDDLMFRRQGVAMDEGGVMAGQGRIDFTALVDLLGHPYFDKTPPKSLDRKRIFGQPRRRAEARGRGGDADRLHRAEHGERPQRICRRCRSLRFFAAAARIISRCVGN